ncbi:MULTISPECIES: AIPR family protein [Shewanella]|uniref:AIPR family protein n=1 Tax=Shewanella TaxID=22 RepID=UPI00201A8D88|nr:MULTISPECIES: AIPR family protein [Shewanella]MCT8866198.1 AIPR family protein [Shewanella xiamenensis]
MTRNDQILINQIIKQEHSSHFEQLSEDIFFEFYTANQLLKNYDLSYDQIENGLCGASLDGGADSIYLFVNGELIEEDTALDSIKRNVEIELVIIQSKNETSFSEDPILKLARLSKNLLDLEFQSSKFINRYNNIVLAKFELFRKTYFELITKKPRLRVNFYYVSKGIDVHPNVQQQIEELKKEVATILTEATVDFETIGATKLLDIYRKKDNEVFSLKLAETPLSSQGKVFISLVRIRDYFKFITDENGVIVRNIFEANVRDYQGKSSVNLDIQLTLESHSAKEDFWWLNNGVTILADDVTAPGGKELIIHNPEIVNGLQTSTEIYRYLSTHAEREDTDFRNILVRVIVPEGEESRDKIIRATNSQTPIPKASLRATDAIHRDIEDYFKPRGLYYDRRKNFYKNEGKKPADIVSIPFLAQCCMAICMQKPDFARARPSTLLEDNASYDKLYNRANDVSSYYVAALVGKRVEEYLKSKDGISLSDRNNMKFYIILCVAILLTENKYPGFRSISNISSTDITENVINKAFNFVDNIYTTIGREDKSAKGPDMISAIKQNSDSLIPPLI